jgi:excisionase family DNA binding protein
MKETLSVRQAAKKFGYTLKYVYDLLYAQKLEGARKNGKIWQIPAAALESWRRRQKR